MIQAFSRGEPSPLPEVFLHYADFAGWQQQIYNEAAIAQHLDYWQRKLMDDQPIEPLSLLAQPLADLGASHYATQLPECLVHSIDSLIPSVQGSEPIPGWEVLQDVFKVLTKQQSWDEISSELYAEDTPLELYLEMSKPMRITVFNNSQRPG